MEDGNAMDVSDSAHAKSEEAATNVKATDKNGYIGYSVETGGDLLQRESEVGIVEYVHAASPGFEGTLKKR
jgi:hypothetical protein